MSKVGITREAYRGSPKGVRSVSFEACELPNREEHWSWRKRGRRNSLTTILDPRYASKLRNIIDQM